jgi:hypothetical protein
MEQAGWLCLMMAVLGLLLVLGIDDVEAIKPTYMAQKVQNVTPGKLHFSGFGFNALEGFTNYR